MADRHPDKGKLQDGLRIAHQVGNGGLSREQAVLLAEAYCLLWDQLDAAKRSAGKEPFAWAVFTADTHQLIDLSLIKPEPEYETASYAIPLFKECAPSTVAQQNDEYTRGRSEGFEAGLLKAAHMVERDADACQPGSPAEKQNWPAALMATALKIRNAANCGVDRRVTQAGGRVEAPATLSHEAPIPEGAPERIYLQHDPDEMGGPFVNDGVTWCWHRINGNDLEYVLAKPSSTVPNFEPVIRWVDEHPHPTDPTSRVQMYMGDWKQIVAALRSASVPKDTRADRAMSQALNEGDGSYKP